MKNEIVENFIKTTSSDLLIDISSSNKKARHFQRSDILNYSKEVEKYRAAIAICLNSRDEIILGKSLVEDDRYGKWCFPGGNSNEGENYLDTAARECFEETGIRAIGIEKIFRDKTKPGIIFVKCRPTYPIESFRPNHEYESLCWKSLEDALSLDLYPSNRAMIKFLLGYIDGKTWNKIPKVCYSE